MMQATPSPPTPLARPGRQWALPALLWTLQIAFLVWTRLLQSRIFVDDAFIHFRNSLHFARFDGLIYNIDEWIIGTTSPIYAALLGLIHAVTRVDLPLLSILVNFALDVAIVSLSLGWLRRAGLPLVARHAIALAGSAEVFRLYYSAGGMEMNLFVVAILGVFESLARGRWLAAGLILSVIGWIRPEGALVWIIAFLALAHLRQWRLLRRVALIAVPAAMIFAAALLVTYHTIFPLSLMAKADAPWYGKVGNSGLDFLFQLASLFPINGLTGFYPGLTSVSNLGVGNLMALASIALCAAGVWKFTRAGHFLFAWAAGGFLTAYYLLYAFASPQICFWYYVPYLWAALFLQGVGVYALIEALAIRIMKTSAPDPLKLARPAAAGALAWCVLSLLTSANNAIHQGFTGNTPIQALAFRHPGFDESSRERRYLRAAPIYNEWIGNETSIAVGCMEIGIFGYYYKGPIFDAYGLVSPKALEVLSPAVQQSIPGEFKNFPLNVFYHARPDMLMVIDDIRANPTGFPGDVYVSIPNPITNMNISVRNDRKDLVARRETIAFD